MYSTLKKQVKRSISSNRYIAYIIGIILLIGLWQVFSLLIGERVMILPGPGDTLEYAIYLLSRDYTYRCIGSTMGRMLAGFGLSFIAALILGVAAGNSEFLAEMFRPLLVVLRAVPTASLIYLFIVFSGFKKAPMLMVAMICFPIIYEGVKDGIRNVPISLINAARVDGSSLLEENIRVRLPLAVPYIIVALATSFSLSFKIEIMAEVITGSTNAGLGSAIAGARASDPTNMIPIFGYSLIAVGLMLMIDMMAQLFIRSFKPYSDSADC